MLSRSDFSSRLSRRTLSGGSPVATTLTTADSAATFLTKVADMTLDEIWLASGDYTWQAVSINTDRSIRPLTIRPATGATVNFVGPATTDGAIFDLGLTSAAKWITFDGRDPVGSTGMVFKDFALAQSGVFQPSGTDHCTFKYLTFQNLSQDTAISGHAAFKSWCFYISAIGVGVNTNLVIDNCRFKAPGISRDISAIQIASSGSGHSVTVTNVLEMTNYCFAFYCEQPATINLNNWTMVNTGRSVTPASIDITDGAGATAVSGSVTNITGTGGCDPYRDTHTGGGTITTSGISIS